MARRLTYRARPALLAATAFLAAGVGASALPAGGGPGPLGASSSDSAYWYYCPAGLVQTGSADSLANGRYCAFWLLKSFPLGGEGAPALNSTAVPGLDVLPVWQRTRGAGVTVAVVDTGVDRGSADLAPNLLRGTNTYDGNDNTTDAEGHGTVIASVIAAPAGNGGYVGIAPEAKILPVKALGGSSGQDWSDRAVVRGIEYAAASGAKVINLSIGGLNTPIAGIDQALAAAQRAGALVVIAAGNDGVDLDDPRYTESPDGYGRPNTLTVANFTTRDTLATDSNYGGRHVQIASLGTVLWGDYPGNATGGYLGGSSAAAAATSGVAALLFAADPSATAAEVRRAIIVGANTDVAALRGKVEANGLLSATGALAALARPDTTPPTVFRAAGPSFTFRSRGSAPVTFRWQAASDPELEGYSLTVDGRTTILPPGTTTSHTALRPGVHRWRLSAYDLSGNRTAATRR
ncbi:MAG TPA: S8 family serine peptidase [Gaiellaceae bacterium]|jgi:subtilisin family serine protease